MPALVYSRRYNIRFAGLERLHPFDSRKYGRAWRELRRRYGLRVRRFHVRPTRPASRDELLLVHTPRHLQRLRDPRYVARALEVAIVRRLPAFAIDWCVLRPMRWATRGTVMAAQEAVTRGLAINLSGGYHHAKPDQGEGFCSYADVGIAVASLRRDNRIGESERLVYIDTDAHQGNGVCHTLMNDNRVFILDIFNSQIYPQYDVEARQRIDCPIPLASGCTGAQYLGALRSCLPGFLDSVGNSPIALAVYNAGTDVFAGDPLGGLQLSAADILERELYVVGELRSRNIPTVMLPSGGYTRQSYQLIAATIIALIEREAANKRPL